MSKVIADKDGVQLISYTDDEGNDYIKMVIDTFDIMNVPDKEPFKSLIMKSFKELIKARKEDDSNVSN